MVLRVLSVRRHVCYLQSVYRCSLVTIRTRGLDETLKVRLPVAEQGQDIVRIIAILCVEALSEEVNISGSCLDRHLQGTSRVMRRVRAKLLKVEDSIGLIRYRAWLLS